MRLVTYLHNSQPRIGVQHKAWVLDLIRAYQALLAQTRNSNEPGIPDANVFSNMLSFLKGGETALRAVRNAITLLFQNLTNNSKDLIQQGIAYPSESVILLPPLLCPGKIICVALNYPAPEIENNNSPSKYPVLFHKVASTLIGDSQPIIIPKISQQVNSEGELVVVIGRPAKYIKQAEALSYVAGYTIANDVGAYDLERRTSQWATGKMLDTFCPMGPALVTRDEVPDPHNLRIRTTLNGQVIQSGNTQEMIFDVPYLVSYLSNITTLQPGDLILTGSPKRVGNAPAPRIFMKPGDMVTIEIEKLGKLTNPVVTEG